jgi:hypothetical protein
MIPTSLLMDPNHTARPVDARAQRVRDLFASGRRRTRHRHDDLWIRRALRYLWRQDQCYNDASRKRLATAYPDIHEAYRINQGPDLDRAEIEARLLARQSISEVAAVTGLTLAGVTAYEALFFSVIDRLDAGSFILTSAMGGNIWDESIGPEDAGPWLRFFGYLKGPIFLQPIIRYYRRGWSLPDGLEKATHDDVEMLQVKALILARSLPFPECFRAARLWDLSIELKGHLERRGADPADATTPAPGTPSQLWEAWKTAVLVA